MKNELRRKVEANGQSPSPFEMMLEPVETKTKKAFVPSMRTVDQTGLTFGDNG